VVALSAAQQTVTNEPSAVPEAVAVAPAPAPKAAAPATKMAAVAHVQTNVPHVDSQDFILQQVGIAPASRSAVTAANPPVAHASAGAALQQSTSMPGRVEIGMADVDTQAYILAQTGPALRNDQRPGAHWPGEKGLT
jgi:hypothetical protein